LQNKKVFLLKVKVEIKLFLCLTKHYAIKTYGETGLIHSCSLDLGTSWRSVARFTARPLYSRGKSPRYLMDRRLDGPQRRSGRYREVKILAP
jgi:hypothetical protein